MDNDGNARFERVPDIGDRVIGFVLILLLVIVLIGTVVGLYRFFGGTLGSDRLLETKFKYPATFIPYRR